MELLALPYKGAAKKINQTCTALTYQNELYQEKVRQMCQKAESSPRILLMADWQSLPVMFPRIDLLHKKIFQPLLKYIPSLIPEDPSYTSARESIGNIS